MLYINIILNSGKIDNFFSSGKAVIFLCSHNFLQVTLEQINVCCYPNSVSCKDEFILTFCCCLLFLLCYRLMSSCGGTTSKNQI